MVSPGARRDGDCSDNHYSRTRRVRRLNSVERVESRAGGVMRTMRIPAMMLATAAQLAWATTSVAAQATPATGTSTADQIAQYTTSKLTTELNLTPDQVPKVQKVNVASAKELEKLVAKYEKDTSIAGDAALVKGYAGLVRANQAELKKILTPAQWTMHQQNKAERLARTQTEFMAYDLDL